MKHILFVAMLFAMACNSSQKISQETATIPNTAKAVQGPTTFAESITEAELKEHLYTYASDEFEGRETGKEGQQKAVAYLKSEYEKLGIPAAKADGNYFQEVPLELQNLPSGTINVNGVEYTIGDDFLSFSKATGVQDNILFLGYGVEEGTYSDYAGLDVTDKWVLIKAGEPMNPDGTFVVSGNDEKSEWSNLSESIAKKTQLAAEKGAKGIFYFDEANFKRYKGYYNYMKNNGSGQMVFKDMDRNSIPSLFIDDKLATKIYEDVEKDVHAKSIPVKIRLDLQSKNVDVQAENVAAVIKGTEKPNEYVIISSHLDHIGISSNGEINNGADDDGSGTVALLEIAEAFKMASDAGDGPKRSIVFLHVTGEEKGLLGSQYYTDYDPIFPLEQTVVDLNIDMIGRIDPKRQGGRNYIYLIGSDMLSTELHNLSEDVNNKYTKLELDYKYDDENDPNRFYYRSDHYNFAKNKIPIIFYFNGTHDDYHRPSDTPDKINYDLLQNRARLIFYTAWEIANRENKVQVDKATK